MNIRPPLGLMPNSTWKRLRANEIFEAMARYSHAQKPIPIEWINELCDLWMELGNANR